MRLSLLACLLASFLAFPVAASAASGKVAFDGSVPSSVRKGFTRAVQQAPRQFRAMAGDVDGQLKVSMGSRKFMKGAAGLATWKTPAERPYRIYFSRAVKWDDLQVRIVAAHELGHIFDFAGISGQQMKEVFLKRAKRSKRYKSCFKRPQDPKRCMPLAEIFADQVAFYAVKDSFKSGYGIPQLLSDRQIGRTLKQMWKPGSTPGGAGGA